METFFIIIVSGVYTLSIGTIRNYMYKALVVYEIICYLALMKGELKDTTDWKACQAIIGEWPEKVGKQRKFVGE